MPWPSPENVCFRNGRQCKHSVATTRKILTTLKLIPLRSLETLTAFSYTAATTRYIEAYLSMFSSAGKLFYDVGDGVSRDDFKDGYTLYAADLTPDMCGPQIILMWCNAEISHSISSSPLRRQLL